MNPFRLLRGVCVVAVGMVLALSAAPAAARIEGATAAVRRSVAASERPVADTPRATGSTAAGPAWGTYRWPVHGEVIRGFEQPETRYSAGHRGIDIAAPFGTPIRAPADGTVSFAGQVAGGLYISIDHAGGIRTTCSWISSVGVKKGQTVRAGEVIGATGLGHPAADRPNLFFSARLDGTYIDPMLLLGGGNLDDLIHLAPSQG